MSTPPPASEMTCGFLIQLAFCKKKLWFTAVKVEQETSAPPPQKNPGSAPLKGHEVIDLIYDTRHLRTCFRIDWIKAMSRGISGGKLEIKSANVGNRGRPCLFS